MTLCLEGEVEHTVFMQDMGFTRAKSIEALEESDNNVELALEWLVNNCA